MIATIHNIVEYSDCEVIQEHFVQYRVLNEQNKEILALQTEFKRNKKLEGISCLIKKTYQEYINNNLDVTDLLSVKSKVKCIRILWNLYKEIENGRLSDETDVRRNRVWLLINADICKGLRV